MSEPAEPESYIGTTLGPCRLEAILGRGGMGVVYRAQHIPLDRTVAVKIPTSYWLQKRQGAAETLLIEARSVARLEDPRIVQVYDVGQHNGIPYVIMQFINGRTLEAKILKSGALTPKEAVGLTREILLALSAAHRNGIIHRDLKPTNILLDMEGRVKLTDFGIAQPLNPQWSASDYAFSGSHYFMAPEQAFGWEPDQRSDLYSLGVLMYYILTGELPYTGRDAGELMVKHREEPIPDARVKNREVTSGLSEIITRLLAKKPEERPSGADEVLKLLGTTGILMEIDSSGSPFRLLPPPVEEVVGFVPPAAALAETADSEATADSLPAGQKLPPPPPPLETPALRPGKISKALFFALYGVFIGPSWLGLGAPDWLGGFLFGATALAMLEWSHGSTIGRKLLGAASVIIMLAGAVGLARAAGGGLAPPSLEAGLLAVISLALCSGSFYLGLLALDSDRGIALSLLGLSVVGLIATAAAWRLAPAAPWFPGLLTIIRGDALALVSSGGLQRWAGFIPFYAGTWIFFPAQELSGKPAENRVVWNN